MELVVVVVVVRLADRSRSRGSARVLCVRVCVCMRGRSVQNLGGKAEKVERLQKQKRSGPEHDPFYIIGKHRPFVAITFDFCSAFVCSFFAVSLLLLQLPSNFLQYSAIQCVAKTETVVWRSIAEEKSPFCSVFSCDSYFPLLYTQHEQTSKQPNMHSHSISLLFVVTVMVATWFSLTLAQSSSAPSAPSATPILSTADIVWSSRSRYRVVFLIVF